MKIFRTAQLVDQDIIVVLNMFRDVRDHRSFFCSFRESIKKMTNMFRGLAIFIMIYNLIVPKLEKEWLKWERICWFVMAQEAPINLSLNLSLDSSEYSKLCIT